MKLFHASDFDSTTKNGIHGCFAMNSQMLRIGEMVGVAGRQSFHLPHSSITWIKSQFSGMSVSTQRPGQLFHQWTLRMMNIWSLSICHSFFHRIFHKYNNGSIMSWQILQMQCRARGGTEAESEERDHVKDIREKTETLQFYGQQYLLSSFSSFGMYQRDKVCERERERETLKIINKTSSCSSPPVHLQRKIICNFLSSTHWWAVCIEEADACPGSSNN